MPPSRPPARSVSRRTPVAVGTISSCATGAARAGLGERVADLHALDGLDRHQRGGEPRVELAVPLGVRAEARRHAVREHLDDAAERVGVPLGGVDLGDHPRARLRVQAAQRIGVDAGRCRAGTGCRPGLAATRARVPPRATRSRCRAPGASRALATVPTAQRAAVSRALARSRIGRASVWPYFCMPARSAWPGRGRVSGALRAWSASSSGSTGSADMTVSPLRPLAVGDPDRDRAAQRDAVPDPADDLDLVLLERHPRAAAVAEPAAGQLARDLRAGHLDPGGYAVEHRDQRGAVRLARGQPTQHADQSGTLRPNATPIHSGHARHSLADPLPGTDGATATPISSGRARSGGVGQRGPHRGDRRGHAGEQRELARRLVQQQVQAGHDRATGRAGAGRERRRPRVVDRVEQHRAGAPRRVAGHRRRPSAPSRSPDRRRRTRSASAHGAVGDRAARARPRPASISSTAPAPAGVHAGRRSAPSSPAPASAAARPCRRRRAPRPSRTGVDAGRAQRVDHAGRVGVVGAPAAARYAYQRVRRADRGRERRRPRRPPRAPPL